MKAMRTVVVLTGLCTALITSCRKNDYVSPDASSISTTQTARAADGNINLNVKTATLTTNSITVQSNGKYIADLGGMRALSMYDPVLKLNLGLEPRLYDNLVTTVHIMPGNMPALHLRGDLSMITGGDQGVARAVDFIYNGTMDLHGSVGTLTVDERTTLLDLLNLHFDQLIANIPKEMWQRAMDQSPYTINISEQSNQELYQIMVSNLIAMMQNEGPVTVNANPMTQAAPSQSYTDDIAHKMQ